MACLALCREPSFLLDLREKDRFRRLDLCLPRGMSWDSGVMTGVPSGGSTKSTPEGC